MELIALLSSGKDTWAQVSGLIKEGDWEKVILLGDESASEFSVKEKADIIEFVKVKLDKRVVDLKDEFSKNLKGKIKGVEVAVTLASGNGKEHMALISALINLPVGIRFAALTRLGVVDL